MKKLLASNYNHSQNKLLLPKNTPREMRIHLFRLRRKIFRCGGLTALLSILSYVFVAMVQVRISSFDSSQAILPDPFSFRLPSRQSIETMEISTADDRKTKWIVLTAVLPGTEDLLQVRGLAGWTILLVADKSTTLVSRSNVKVLNLNKQLGLGYKVLEFLPQNSGSHSRKIIGYLYAIQHGAKFIYDATDMDAHKIYEDSGAFEAGLVLKQSTRGLLTKACNSVINPYAHFGKPDISPRGLPYNYIGEGSLSSSYTACKMTTPIIQQVIDNNLDVDAFYNLAGRRPRKASNTKIEFDSSAPPLVLPKSVLAPFNSKSTLFHYNSFWALLLPMSVLEHGDIWRGYWAQPLLWSIGANLGYFIGDINATATRDSSVPFLQPSTTKALRNQTAHLRLLIEYLKTWSCAEKHIYSCMWNLTASIARKGLWSPTEIGFLRAWISDLMDIGYNPPKLSSSKSSSVPCLPENTQSAVIFQARDIRMERTDETLLRRTHLRKFCNFPSSLPTNPDPTAPSAKRFPSTLLVVVFNSDYYDNIWLLDLIYRPHFPNIVYCGPPKYPGMFTKLLASDKFKETHADQISFIRANTTKGDGCFNYECALRAIDMNYNVDGYLIVQDDVLLNIWNIDKYDKSEAWMQYGQMVHVHTHLSPNLTEWFWWNSEFGYDRMKDSLNEIYNESNNVHVQQFRVNRDSYGYNGTAAIYSTSELFYFPASKKEMFYEVGSILRYFEVYLEIAVPFIQTGLSDSEHLTIMPGKRFWLDDRLNPFRFFGELKDWIHPVKYGDVYNNTSPVQKEYCDLYVYRLLST